MVDTLAALHAHAHCDLYNINILLLTGGALFTPVRARTHYAIKFFTHSRPPIYVYNNMCGVYNIGTRPMRECTYIYIWR